MRNATPLCTGQGFADMASEGVDYPMEVLMDSQTGNCPPLPPRPGQRRSRTIQTALFIMVSVALLAVAVEACFIYHLYKTKQSSVSP